MQSPLARSVDSSWRVAVVSVAVVAALAVRAFFVSAPADAQTGGLIITSGPSVATSEITDTMATIRWSTNLDSIGRVNYGETSALGLSWRKLEGIGPDESEVSEAAHVLRLEELKPATTYFYKVVSQNESGAVESGQASFTTKAGTVPPLRSLRLTSPATGAKVRPPLTLRALVDGRADLLYFTWSKDGGTSSRCDAKLDGDSGSEQNWSCGLNADLLDGAYSVKADATGKDEAGAAVSKGTVTIAFEVEGAVSCEGDTWTCSAWLECSGETLKQGRVCSHKAGCPTPTDPKPEESRSCIPPCKEDGWSCGTWGTCARDASGKLMQSRSCTFKFDCPNVTTPKPETTRMCLPTPGCTSDSWSCGDWTSCAEPGTKTKTRTCTLEMDCPTATTRKPDESAECPPPCKEDEWYCTAWGMCDKTGQERRTCTISNDCPNVETPKPPEARDCMPGGADVNAPMIDECERDIWQCSAWGECKDGSRARTCKLALDCPNDQAPNPGETETCVPQSAQTAPPQNLRAQAVEAVLERMSSDLRSAVQDFEKNTENVSGGFGLATTTPDANEPAQTKGAGADLTALYVDAKDLDQMQTLTFSLAAECTEASIGKDRCAAWLEVRHANKECAAAGIFSKEACDKHLTEKNDGTFPGCAGKTPEECDKVKALALLGYPTSDVKTQVDDILKKAADENIAPPLPGLLAADDSVLDKLAVIPSVRVEGQESSPSLVVLDTDQDGLPDDTERRFGTDPLRSDVAIGGDPNANLLPRNIIKTFFEKGDKPTQFVLIDTDGDGELDLIEDRKLLGLKTYDESRVYLIGDTAVRTREVLKAFFETGDKPTQQQFGNLIDSMIAVDTDGDGGADAHVSREFLKSRFETGDIPDQHDFADTIDSAFLTGAALEQPHGAGQVDTTFLIDIDLGGTPVSMPPLDANQPAGQVSEPPDANTPQLGIPVKVPYSGQLAEDGELVDGSKTMTPVIRGRATPNSVVTIYIYSYVPMVLTTTTDENGNFEYDLSTSVIDGEHTAYVAITDESGKIVKKSNPLSFFVKEAQAASEEDFLRPDAITPTESIAQWQQAYLIGAAVAMLLALVVVWRFVMRRMPETPTPPAPPAEPGK